MPNAALSVVLDDISLNGTALAANNTSLVQTTGNVGLTATSLGGRRVALVRDTMNATVSAHVELGDRPIHLILTPRLYNVTGPVRIGGTAILSFIGPPNRAVEWQVIQGHATLTPFTRFTDELGRCSCRFESAGVVETVMVGATYVP